MHPLSASCVQTALRAAGDLIAVVKWLRRKGGEGMRKRDETCRHFNGLIHDQCEVGVTYMKVFQDVRGRRQWPCLCPKISQSCAKFENWTDEELAQHEAELAAFLNNLTAFEQRKSEACPQCGKHVDNLRQIGRCVYASPCNCRVWQGHVPQAWK